eukprot:5620180-Karenia_brevis.AAC.1
MSDHLSPKDLNKQLANVTLDSSDREAALRALRKWKREGYEGITTGNDDIRLYLVLRSRAKDVGGRVLPNMMKAAKKSIL